MNTTAEKRSVEDPERLEKFIGSVRALVWSGAETLKSLNETFLALDQLALAEVKYYYKRRFADCGVSGWLRGLAIFSTVVGTLIPLLAATSHPWFASWTPWGYVWLAVGAGLYAADQLFGGTTGHARNVVTQVKLEKTMTDHRLKWLELCSTLTGDSLTPEQRKEAFALIQKYGAEVYAILEAETDEWRMETMTQLKDSQDKLNSRLERLENKK